METNMYKNIFHLNCMHCLPMFIASQREFGGKNELAKYGFDYRDLYQRWNGAFYQLPIPPPPPASCPLLKKVEGPIPQRAWRAEKSLVLHLSIVRSSVSIWGLVLVGQ